MSTFIQWFFFPFAFQSVVATMKLHAQGPPALTADRSKEFMKAHLSLSITVYHEGLSPGAAIIACFTRAEPQMHMS
jgi:hypothetical protein